MAKPLAIPDDVADLWRPLTTDETGRVFRLIDKASALLRQKVPWVDARMVLFTADPGNIGGLDPQTVANVTATIVKRFLVNPDGATNTSETTGPFSYSKGFALRGDKDVRGELLVTESDILALTPAQKSKARIGTIRTSARMAPWPYGNNNLGNVDSLLLLGAMSDPSWEFGPFINYPPGA